MLDLRRETCVEVGRAGRNRWPWALAGTAREAIFACAVACAFAAPAAHAHAQPSVEVNRYRPAPHPRDGFVLERPRVGDHLSFFGHLHVDYANDPLVYERSASDSDSELVALVGDQVTAHLSGGLALFGMTELHFALPVHLAMNGEELGNQPTATGFGAGDLRFGGLLVVHDGPFAKIALAGLLRLPTGEAGDERPGVAGDSGVSFEPRAIAELDLGAAFVLMRVGLRWRDDVEIASASFGDVVTFGAGAAIPFFGEGVRLHAELDGESPIDDVGDRAATPIGALLGVKITPLQGLTMGAGAGAGITRGYGSPDARVVFTAGYVHTPSDEGESTTSVPAEPIVQETPVEEPEPEPEPGPVLPVEQAPTEDLDADGFADVDDSCPDLPGSPENNGCPVHLQYDPDTGEITLLSPIVFTGRAELAAHRSPALEEIVAVLRAKKSWTVRVEAHLAPSRGDTFEADTTSVERAFAVATWLREQGIASARLEAVGCGERRPRTTRRARRSDNERVELHVLSPLPRRGMRSMVGCSDRELPPDPGAVNAAPKALRMTEPVQKPAPSPAPATPPAQKPAPSPAPATPPAQKPAPPPQPAQAPKPQAPPLAKPASSPPSAASAPTLAPAALGAAAVLAAVAASPNADDDRDGIKNAKDECPLAPGKGKACPETHRLDLEAGRIELLVPVRFDDASDAPNDRAAKVIEELASTLRANPKMKVALEAHVAEENDAQATAELTKKRAARVKAQLVERGASATQVRALGCGQSRPVAPNNVPWGRKKNDRVEVHVLDPGPSGGVHSVAGCMEAGGR